MKSACKVLEVVVLSVHGEMEVAREEKGNGTGHALVAPDGSGQGTEVFKIAR